MIDDPRRAVDSFTLRRLVSGLKREIAGIQTTDLGELFNLVGLCHLLLKEPAAALDALRNAARYKAATPILESNIAAALIDLGRSREALPHLESALATPHPDRLFRMTALGNLAECRNATGDATAARLAFESAVRVVDPSNPDHGPDNLRLARHAVACGYRHDAAEFVARYLVAVHRLEHGEDDEASDVIRKQRERATEAVRYLPELQQIVEAVPEAALPDDEPQFRTRFELDADGWAQFCSMANLPAAE